MDSLNRVNNAAVPDMENSKTSRTVAFITLGCKVNQYETQVMRESLKESGYRIVAPEQVADVYVINTCTVTSISDRKSRQIIRRLAALNPDATVVVTGCYAERSPDEIKDIPGVDLVLSNQEKFYIGEYLKRAENPPESPFGKGGLKGLFLWERETRGIVPLGKEEQDFPSPSKGIIKIPPFVKGGQGGFEDSTWYSSNQPAAGFTITSFDGQTRALVKIEDGCDSLCTYCIVPYVRGSAICSRPIASIVQEVRTLAESGYREVVLTGIHLGAYGRDLSDGATLCHVLRAVGDDEGIGRIRMSSIEPMDISDDLINEAARLPKCAHHFHISLQSGSDKILRLMKRGYTSAEFKNIVDRVRSAIPDVGISTDVMVGFPGETEQDFADTYDLIARVRFSRFHVFRYSPREGTPAARFPHQVQNKVASRRSQEIRSLGEDLAREFHARMLGQEAEVLIEDSREGKCKLRAGFTSNYVRVLVADAPDELVGRIIRVKLTDIEDEYMIGTNAPPS